MFKYCLLTIFLYASSIAGLLETLFQAQNNCYSKCDLNHAVGLSNSDACKKGCDYKLYNKNCAVDCKLFSTDERTQNSCLDGCSSSNLVLRKPVQNEPTRSIILIRLRQRPLVEPSSLNAESMKMFMDMIRKLNNNRNLMTQSADEIDTDYLNNEDPYKVTRVIIPRKNKVESMDNRFKTFFNNIHSEWNDLIRKQPQIPAWILFVLLLIPSVFLFYMIISLYFHVRTLSIRARQFACDNIYEKEKLTLNEAQCQYADSKPIKF